MTRADQKWVSGSHRLLPIQARFFAEDVGERDHWNQAVMLRPKDRLDWEVMGRTIAAVLDHHDACGFASKPRTAVARGAWRRSGVRLNCCGSEALLMATL